jgi:hypothetical protein
MNGFKRSISVFLIAAVLGTSTFAPRRADAVAIGASGGTIPLAVKVVVGVTAVMLVVGGTIAWESRCGKDTYEKFTGDGNCATNKFARAVTNFMDKYWEYIFWPYVVGAILLDGESGRAVQFGEVTAEDVTQKLGLSNGDMAVTFNSELEQVNAIRELAERAALEQKTPENAIKAAGAVWEKYKNTVSPDTLLVANAIAQNLNQQL